MSEQTKHNVNFFLPQSKYAKFNTKLIALFVCIWFVAVFGFQLLLIAIQKPVPEKTLKDFNMLWPKVKNMAVTDTTIDTAKTADVQSFVKALLTTLGKNATVKKDDCAVIEKALEVGVLLLLPPNSSKVEVNDQLLITANTAIELGDKYFDPLLKDQLRVHLKFTGEKDFSAAKNLPASMSKYLIHYRSFLTDSKFLGFPFHYFYTAQFLLILFVVLCLIYAILIDKTNKKLGIQED